ncbi:MAG: dephospho-CoA kinase [Saprospiraceae bacterium]|nr:dephospho-CoA kinase [Saprospiraceae bacterium]
MLIAGLTGGIGSGKSMVATVFGWLGVPIYDSDKRAKILMSEHPELIQEIKDLFGKKAYTQDQQLNRSWIAGKVFNNEKLLSQLNAIVHPRVFEDFDQWVSVQQSTYVIKESALLHITLEKQAVDKIILVLASEKLRLKRVMSRDGLSSDQVKARMQHQIKDLEKVLKADYLIDNNGEIPVLPQILNIHHKICNFANQINT